MKFVNDNPAPPKEVTVTVTFPFDEFMAIMRLIENSDRITIVDELQWATEKDFDRLQEIYDTFFNSDYYRFYRLWND